MEQISALRPAPLTNTSSLTTKKSRNMGIDFLRILSMMLVLTLHVLRQGGVLASTTFLSANHKTLWLLETLAFCSVNCYGLITGYVSVNNAHKSRRIISLWFQVAFYTIVCTVIWSFVFPGSVKFGEVLTAIFPVLNKQYWYFTAYFALFCFIPFLNKMVHALTKRQHGMLVATIVILFSIAPTTANTDPFNVGGGYSFLWLMALYIIGAYLKLYEAISPTTPNGVCLFFYFPP